jgi:hypothetical protein
MKSAYSSLDGWRRTRAQRWSTSRFAWFIGARRWQYPGLLSRPCSFPTVRNARYTMAACFCITCVRPMADHWIGYRELPGGNFYSQAFQGYSGDRLARTYGEKPQAYAQAARRLDGMPLPDLPGVAFAFLPLPRIRLAAILYPGDEEFAARASVLFDAAASHYMTTDGLALLGAGLVGRMMQIGKY